MELPGKNSKLFIVFINKENFKRNELIQVDPKYKALVLEAPKRKIHHLLFQYISFGLFKAKYSMKIKILDNE